MCALFKCMLVWCLCCTVDPPACNCCMRLLWCCTGMELASSSTSCNRTKPTMFIIEGLVSYFCRNKKIYPTKTSVPARLHADSLVPFKPFVLHHHPDAWHTPLE